MTHYMPGPWGSSGTNEYAIIEIHLETKQIDEYALETCEASSLSKAVDILCDKYGIDLNEEHVVIRERNDVCTILTVYDDEHLLISSTDLIEWVRNSQNQRTQ